MESEGLASLSYVFAVRLLYISIALHPQLLQSNGRRLSTILSTEFNQCLASELSDRKHRSMGCPVCNSTLSPTIL